MSNQYFDNNETLKSEPQRIEFYYRGKVFNFITDHGVFSIKNIDFGTRLLLQNIPQLDKMNHVLDVGCGYGAIGITLATLFPNVEFDLIDVNKRALVLAKNNADNYHLNNVNIFESDVYQNVSKEYDMIITNPPIRAGKAIVHKILLNSFDYLKTDGTLWCVIQKKQGALSAIKALNEVFKAVETVDKDKGYYIIKAKK